MKFLLIDLALVTGLDSTGMLSFQKMQQFAAANGIQMVLTGLHGRIAAQFQRSHFDAAHLPLMECPDLDRGVEWCEDQIIEAVATLTTAWQSLESNLAATVDDPQGIRRLVAHMDRLDYAPGEYLIRQGEAANELFFIESGQITVLLETDGEPLRLQTVSGGHVVGELAFYLDVPRTASVIVDQVSVVYRLTRDDLATLMSDDPAAALTLHHLLAKLLSKRVVHLTTVVNALKD
jgi:SulP family sulfate permease